MSDQANEALEELEIEIKPSEFIRVLHENITVFNEKELDEIAAIVWSRQLDMKVGDMH